ncbi:uncharacterized protein LOC132635749 isoform X2 [Lycium barbarum]|uniref:uncharacterized protein LOC132635749 isoform X2 n=1 Tax=Lycium barbarum TaxID=112863 RepID=UPI00293EFD79|nr:uncharacterized protein LOC132635749 isoform X2 [Lycium barbarum]
MEWSSHRSHKTTEFKLFELDIINGEVKKEINTLGESAIFLDRNGPISIDSSKFKGVEPNYIYFTNDWYDHFGMECGKRDTGTYNLETEEIENFYPELSLSPAYPLTWITPSFHDNPAKNPEAAIENGDSASLNEILNFKGLQKF